MGKSLRGLLGRVYQMGLLIARLLFQALCLAQITASVNLPNTLDPALGKVLQSLYPEGVDKESP
jgi:hypothetical protein